MRWGRRSRSRVESRGWLAHRLALSSPRGARTGAKENPAGKQFPANLLNNWKMFVLQDPD